ncbi:MAG: hypothetical protein ABR579_04850 [Actinomycetota bacterium]
MNKGPQQRHGRSRKNLTTTVVVSLFASLIVAGIPTASWGAGSAKPSIAFLNPSSFSSSGERGITISNQPPDSGPGCCDGATDTYRLSAWVSDPPPNYSVFFSFEQNSLDLEITNTQQTQEGDWQSQWSIPATVLDGPATLHAYVVVNEEAVAEVMQPVTITKEADTNHIAYPQSDGMFGTYAALATALPAKGAATRKLPAGTVDVQYTGSPSSSYIRTFYTTSAPGTEPNWKECATESVGSNGADNGIRCTLASADDQAAVTALASVINDSPNDYDDRFNQSGDAVAVSPYVQQPTALTIDPAGASQRVGLSNSEIFFCSTASLVTLTDQLGRQIPGANIDVHATGPSDTLKFDTFSTVLSKNKAPDRGDHAEQTAYDCTGQNTTTGAPPGDANPDTEGVHRRFGAPDRKHIESLGGGTSDAGTFSFRFHADDVGQTDFTAWVDEQDDGCLTNDDLFLPGELYAVGAVGWGQDPITPVVQPYESAIPCSPDGGTPTPTDTPPTREPGSISLAVTDGPGAAVTLRGHITSDTKACKASQPVKLQMRKKGHFHTFGTATTTKRGRYEFVQPITRSHAYRAVVPATTTCSRARSPIVRE